MRLEIVPALPEPARRALVLALARAGLRLDGAPEAYSSAWRRAAVLDAVESWALPEPRLGSYAPSPRRTRGATRA